MSVAHDIHTRFPAGDPATNLNNADTTTGDRSFTHTPGGTPKGVVVTIVTMATAAPVTGVTYGGIAMTFRQSAVDTSEPGRVDVYTLTDVTIPTGAQTVVLQGCSSGQKFCTCSTVLAATNQTTFVGGGQKGAGPGGNHLVTFVTTAEAMLYGGVHSGVSTIDSIPPDSNLTGQNYTDWGISCARTARSTIPQATGTVSFSFPAGGSDDNAIAAVAIGQLGVDPSFVPRYSSINFQNPAVV